MAGKRQATILIVEDDDSHAELIARALASWEIPPQTKRLSDGESAVNYLITLAAKSAGSRGLPDLILLDLKLPRMSGLGVLERIKGDSCLRQIPVITLTSSQADTDIEAAYTAHTNSYLVKPLGYKSFRETLGTIERFWIGQNRLSPALL